MGEFISRAKADAIKRDFVNRCMDQIRRMDNPEFIAELYEAAQTGGEPAVRAVLTDKVAEFNRNGERFLADAHAEIGALPSVVIMDEA